MTGRPTVRSHDKPVDTSEKEEARREVEETLEEALEDSFPASDPVQIVQPQRPEPGTAKEKIEECDREERKDASRAGSGDRSD
ncbi:MAG TPA: hypothetical protein VHA77_09475 [Xanthobacteraceae bacterium]|nr:hypothetical protein [Xanthobacteraceae bacterium]